MSKRRKSLERLFCLFGQGNKSEVRLAKPGQDSLRTGSVVRPASVIDS